MLTRRAALLAALGAVTGCSGSTATAGESWTSPWRSPWASTAPPGSRFAGHLIAHRSRAGDDPENTVQSMLGLPVWVDGVEADVRLTADDVPVLMHDETVDRTTDGTGPIADLTLAEVKRLDAGGGTRVPTLADYLAACDDRRWRRILLDMKATDAAAYEAAADVVRASPLSMLCIVMVRPGGEAARFRAADRVLPLGSFRATTDNIDQVIGEMTEHHGRLILTDPERYAQHREAATKAAAAGFECGASTSNDGANLLAARDDGVDVVLTDIADQLAWY